MKLEDQVAPLEKECRRCREARPLDDFSPDHRAGDGKQSRCKPCMREINAATAMVAIKRDWQRRRADDPEYRAARAEQARVRRAGRHAPKAVSIASRARDAARWAVRSGKINRQPCEVCGSVPAQMHHDDYSKPLDVRWLCAMHHKRLHVALAESGALDPNGLL